MPSEMAHAFPVLHFAGFIAMLAFVDCIQVHKLKGPLIAGRGVITCWTKVACFVIGYLAGRRLIH